MSEPARCPRCGGDFSRSGGDEHCPGCLLALVMAGGTESVASENSLEEIAYHGHGLVLLGMVGEGGIGVVYEAEQLPMGRIVAVKILRDEHRKNPELRGRFEVEARIGARLQHPGVLPVYQAGSLGDRPYFTMRRVEGRSFAEALAGGPTLTRSLGVFLQVCQALAYAHDQGVVHLDIKPANVMVGEFGEVVLLDWGMARERVGEQASGLVSVMGTAAYMAPEQARGEAGAIDERSDVFGLGSLLCEVLTGRPPYVGKDHEAVRRMSREADLADALGRIDGADAPPELKALARSCLAKERSERPRHAGEVAAAVTAYEEGARERLRVAEQARWRAEGIAAGERKRRRLTVLLAAVCGGVGLWFWNARTVEARRELERAQVVDRALDEAGRLRALGRSMEARASAEAARAVLGDAGPELRRRAAERLDDFETLALLEDARFTPGQAGDPRIASARAEAYAAAFRRLGVDLSAVDPSEAAERIRNRPIRADLVVALDDWARASRDQPTRGALRALAAAADPDPQGVGARLRRALSARDRAAVVALATAPDLKTQPAAVLVSLGATLREAGASGEAAAVLRQAQEAHPSDFLVNLELAVALAALAPPDAVGSDAFLTAALALSDRNPGVYFYLGQAHQDAGRLDRAVDAYRAAITIKPDYAEAYNNLGNALTAQRDLNGAVAAFEKAIESRPRYALAYFNLGYALDDRGDYEASADAYRQAVASRPDYGEAYCNLGYSEYRQGLFRQAVADMNRGLGLVSPNDPKRPTWRQLADLGKSLADLEPKLVAAMAATTAPASPAEAVGFARLCAWRNRQLHARAVQFYEKAFADSPALAEDLVVGDRYAAAGSAAMAGGGRGRDSDSLSPEERAGLRRRALGWLRADLALRARIIAAGGPAADQSRALLRYWRVEPNFEPVRSEEVLGKLPDEERADWRAFWAEHAALAAPPAPVSAKQP